MIYATTNVMILYANLQVIYKPTHADLFSKTALPWAKDSFKLSILWLVEPLKLRLSDLCERIKGPSISVLARDRSSICKLSPFFNKSSNVYPV